LGEGSHREGVALDGDLFKGVGVDQGWLPDEEGGGI
jgi:hypothetical protein